MEERQRIRVLADKLFKVARATYLELIFDSLAVENSVI